MRSKQLLFVVYHDESFDEGLTYAIDLAKVMNDSISLMIIQREGYEWKRENHEERLKHIAEKCRYPGSPWT